MNRQGVWGWHHCARVLSAVFVVLVAVAPAAAPVNAWRGVDETQYLVGFSQALPAWWVGTAGSGLRPSADASSYGALPVWWHQRGPAAVRSARPMQVSVTGMAIYGPAGTAVITKSLRTDEPYTFFAVVTETTGQTNTREAIWTLSPEFGSLSPEVGISTELDGFQVGTTVLTAALATTPTISATARISFTPGTVAWLSLVPEDEILTAGQSVVYSADAYDADANVVGDVTGATAFTIDDEAQGSWGGNVYTSAMAGAWAITGTHERAPGQWVSGTAELTIRPGALTTLTITPDAVPVTVGTVQVFTATGTDLLGNSVLVTPTWTALGGEIDPGPAATTVFTAQTTPADGLLVTATQGVVSATAVVTVVHGPLHTFAFSPTLIATQTAGEGIALALLARDEFDNLATRYNGTVNLSVSSGTIAPEAVDLNDGEWQGVVTLTQAADSVYVVASDDPITGRSNDFALVPAALDHIRINSAPDNGGARFGYPVEVGTHVMDVYDVYPVWGSGYDQFENYRGDLTVTWGLTGVLAYGSITPTPAISATLIPAAVLSGTGVITASYVPSGFVDGTGLFTVNAPWLVIRKARTWPHTEAVPAGTENMEYTIVFSNVGSADAQNVRITETYDSNVSYSVAVPRPDTGTDNIWTLPVLRKDEPQTILVFVDVGSSLAPGTVLTNLVEIGGPRVQAAGFSVTTVVTSAPALDVSLTDLGNDPVDVGDPFNLQVTYANSGTAPVDGIVLTLSLDAYVSFVNAQVAPVIAPTPGNGNVGRWELGSLSGESESSFLIWLDIDTFVPDQYALSNDVVINSAQTEPAYDMELTTVNAPELALGKVAVPNPAIAYDRLEYTLIYSNVGHLDAPNLIITDRFPADVNYVSCQPAPCYRSGDTVTWERAQGLAAGADALATLVVNVHRNLDSGTVITNVARMRVFDEPRYSAADTITTTVLSSPSLVLSISDGKDWAEAGDELVYAISTNNVGSGRAYDTMIVANVPSTEHVMYQGCLPSNVCERVGEQVIYDLGTVSGGAGSMVFMNVAVLDPLPAGARAITASATINTVTPGDPPEDNVAQDVDQIITRPDLVVTADYQDFYPKPGKRVTYTMHYSNEGRMLALGVVLTANKAQYAEFDVQASDPRWELHTNDSVRFEAGDLDFGEGGELSLVTTLPDVPELGGFTPVMTNFDACFEIYEAGGTGEDTDLETNTFHAPLGVPNLAISDLAVDPAIRGGGPGYLTVTVENSGYGPSCGALLGEIACRGANVDVFVNPTTELKSFPVANYGDCFVNFDPIQPGLTRSLMISFTTVPRSEWPEGGELGFCVAVPIVALWLKTDNWTTVDEQPPVEEYGLVPEFNEWDNLRSVFLPGTYLPIIIREQ